MSPLATSRDAGIAGYGPCRTGAAPERAGYGRPADAWITADVSDQQDSGMPSGLGSGAASAASKPTALSLRMRADTPSVR